MNRKEEAHNTIVNALEWFYTHCGELGGLDVLSQATSALNYLMNMSEVEDE